MVLRDKLTFAFTFTLLAWLLGNHNRLYGAKAIYLQSMGLDIDKIVTVNDFIFEYSVF
jgi:hypothetical protein